MQCVWRYAALAQALRNAKALCGDGLGDGVVLALSTVLYGLFFIAPWASLLGVCVHTAAANEKVFFGFLVTYSALPALFWSFVVINKWLPLDVDSEAATITIELHTDQIDDDTKFTLFCTNEDDDIFENLVLPELFGGFFAYFLLPVAAVSLHEVCGSYTVLGAAGRTPDSIVRTVVCGVGVGTWVVSTFTAQWRYPVPLLVLNVLVNLHKVLVVIPFKCMVYLLEGLCYASFWACMKKAGTAALEKSKEAGTAALEKSKGFNWKTPWFIFFLGAFDYAVLVANFMSLYSIRTLNGASETQLLLAKIF